MICLIYNLEQNLVLNIEFRIQNFATIVMLKVLTLNIFANLDQVLSLTH